MEHEQQQKQPSARLKDPGAAVRCDTTKAPSKWDVHDLDEYGTYATAHFAHSQMYYVRDVSKLWCEQACERNDMHLARHCAERYERACKVLQEWQCTGCAICPRLT